MRIWLARINSWFHFRRLSFERLAVLKAEAALNRHIRELKRLQKRLAATHRWTRMVAKTLAEDWRLMDEKATQVEASLMGYNTAMEAMSSKVKIMEEVTIPQLVEECRSQLERSRAESSIQIRRQANAEGREEQ